MNRYPIKLWIFAGLMAMHWLEHIFQAVQVYVLHVPRHCAFGLLGMKYPELVRGESLHFIFAGLTFFFFAWLIYDFHGTAIHWWFAGLCVSFWHWVEHVLLFFQAQTHIFLFGRPEPTSVLQLVFPRIELHLFYNSIITLLMVIALYYCGKQHETNRLN